MYKSQTRMYFDGLFRWTTDVRNNITDAAVQVRRSPSNIYYRRTADCC